MRQMRPEKEREREGERGGREGGRGREEAAIGRETYLQDGICDFPTTA